MRWKPAHEMHAIERVSTTIEFFGGIPIKPLETITQSAQAPLTAHGLAVASDVRAPGLNVGDAQPQLLFQIGPGGVILNPANNKVWRTASASGRFEQVTIGPNIVAYQTTVYDRWHSYSDRFELLLRQSLEAFLALENVRNIKLEYWDRFVSEDDSTDADFSTLFRPHSKFVPGFAMECHELWHSHVGYFNAERGRAEKRLVNLNVDIIDLQDAPLPDAPGAQRRSAGIYSLAQDTFTREHNLDDFSGLRVTLDELHLLLKEVLEGTISEAAAKRINLRESRGQ